MEFLSGNFFNFDWNFTEICSQSSSQLEQESSIDSDNGLVPNRWQFIKLKERQSC